ncbi:MAG TPA: pyrimidine dimer DNA glycosylase/endonuclease V [Acidobacteriota bacterium]|nr:pyrimidine dimer DNA glycosylase/endonuclease V [Acidobacteriota bacterium]
MRIWDLEPALLCRQHLLGEHRELHAVWSILTNGKRGYRRHPEVIRWQGALRGLSGRHDRLVAEMERRGYRHLSPLDRDLARGARRPRGYVDEPDRQRELLKGKGCDCRV